MRRRAVSILVLGAVCLGTGALCAAPAKITKVLIHLLDEQGRHTVAPSLYERDAYQAELRYHPERVSTLRFDVHWKFSEHYMQGIRLQLEVRGSKDPKVLLLEATVEKRRWYQRWTSFRLDRATYARLGEVVAWRATVWDGDRLIAEQRSFLW